MALVIPSTSGLANLRVTSGDRQLHVSWTIVHLAGSAILVKWRPSGSTVTWRNAPTRELSPTATSFTITGLTDATEYDVLVEQVQFLMRLIGTGTPTSTLSSPPQTQTFQPKIIPLSASEIPNSGRGQYIWNGQSSDPSGMPAPDLYLRDNLHWKNIETSKGVYDFSVIDQWLSNAQSKDGRLGFRVMAFSPGFGGNLAPSYIPTDPQNSLMVQWNSETFLIAWRDLMQHLGARYANNPRLGWVDIGGYGSWGEWHLYQQPGTPITDINMRVVIQSVIDAFPNKPLMAMTANATFLADALSLSPKIGCRMDCLGAPSFCGSVIDKVPDALSRWQTAPIITEWCNGTCGASADEFATGDSQVQDYHVSLLSSGNYPTRYANMNSGQQSSFMHANKIAGFRYELNSVTIPSSLMRGQQATITSNWSNVGVAPTYDRWQVEFLLKDESGDVQATIYSTLSLRRLLPGQHQQSDTFTLSGLIGTGTMTLAVRVTDLHGYLAPMNLAIEGRAGDGSYSLGTVSVS